MRPCLLLALLALSALPATRAFFYVKCNDAQSQMRYQWGGSKYTSSETFPGVSEGSAYSARITKGTLTEADKNLRSVNSTHFYVVKVTTDQGRIHWCEEGLSPSDDRVNIFYMQMLLLGSVILIVILICVIVGLAVYIARRLRQRRESETETEEDPEKISLRDKSSYAASVSSAGSCSESSESGITRFEREDTVEM